MAKPIITTRATKGSALTWTEGDTNLTNLRDATIGITDGTTSGTLDLNDTLTFTAGTNVTLSYNSTSKALTINASGGSSLPSQSGNTDKVLTTDGSTASWTDTLTGKTLTKYKETIYSGGSQSNAYTPNWNNGPVQTVTLTGNVTFAAPTNMVAGATLTLILTQDGTGGRTGTWNASYKWMGGTPVLSTASSSIDVVNIFYDGTNYISGISKQDSTSSLTNLQLNTQGELRFADSDSSNYVGFKSPSTVSTNKIWTLPSADGTNNQVLTTNGSGVLSWSTPSETYTGTVTSVAALTLGTSGTDISSTVATETTTPVITLNIPTASATNRGALSSTDWSTFNGKQDALTSGTNIKTINSTSLLGSGDIAITTTPAGSNQQIQFNNAGAMGASSGLYYDGTSLKCSSGNIESLYTNGDEGGEFRLATATTNTTLAGGSVAIDIYQNRLRIFETGGSTRGVYLDLTGAANTVGSALAVQGTAASFTTLTSTTSASLKAINEGALYDLGTTGGTIAPNVANGNVQKITLNSALTINAFTSPVAGQSLTLIIYGGTAYTSITSTMKFAGGIKTLTGTAGCIDILSVYYDGTNYFASLGKGFA